MPTVKPNKSEEIIGEIFKDQELVYGLKEFDGIDIYDVLYISEQEPHRFYIKDLKTGTQRFVYDEEKKTGKPEEIVRQNYLLTLINEYGYSLDQLDEELAVTGRGSGKARADFVIWKTAETPIMFFPCLFTSFAIYCA